MEHLEEILRDKENVAGEKMLFKFVFGKLPTYSDL
jgi:hypothetical protein